MTEHVVGLDIGSTYLKAVLLRTDGAFAHEARKHTPWRHLPGGHAEMDAPVLLAEVADLLAALGAAVPPGGRVVGIGVSGMAEAGVLVDGDGHVDRPVPAWFDPRGDAEAAGLDPDLAAEFPRRTGLPVGPLPTFAKLLHARATGVRLAGPQWLNLPEYVAHALGGGRFGEPSLRSRTGLVDQDTGEAWAAPLALLDAPDDLLPPRRTAGEPWGAATRLVPPALRGAVLTVAGHDHLVASVAESCVDRGDLYDSIGTAEALLRVVAGTTDGDTRARLAGQGISVGAHLLPGRGVLLAGIKTGLILRRVLQLVGITDAAGRAALDDRVSALGPDAPAAHALRVTGADNADGVLTLRVDGDGLSPELFFATALDHSTRVVVEVLARMDAAVGRADRTVLSGGWCAMRAVRRARAAVLPRVQVSERIEATVHGAGMVAAFACSDPGPDRDLVAFARAFGARAPDPPALDAPALDAQHEPTIGKGGTR